MMAMEVATDEDPEAGTGAAAGLLHQLTGDPIGGDDVVAADDALVLHAEDLLEIHAAHWHEGGGGVGGGAGELGVQRGEDVFAEVAIGQREGGDAGQPGAVDEAALQGAIGALAAPRAWGE